MSHILCDLGSYSLKYCWANVSRKKISYQVADEINYPPKLNSLDYLERLRFLIEFLDEQNYLEMKIYLNLDDHLLTSRYLKLPVAQKKKALQMLPFQLEEQLPNSIESQHYASIINSHTNSSSALSQIISKQRFQEIFNIFEEYNFYPALISSNLFYLNSNLLNVPSTCAIIDIGHRFSNFFAIRKNQLLADETYHFGGLHLSEMISQVYNIDNEETEIFKHRHSFYLTKLQYEEAEQDQKDFALLMAKSTQNFITEINRWRLSVRVNKGYSIEKIYLTGGSSQIKNICEFLHEKTGIEFSLLKYNEQQTVNFNLFNSSNSIISKNNVPNFFTGDFVSKNLHELPLANLSTILSRGLIFTSVIAFFFIIETFLVIKPEMKLVTRQLNKVLKKTKLAISRKDKRVLRRSPKRFLKSLTLREKKIDKKFNRLSQKELSSPLVILNKFSSALHLPQSMHLEKFVTDGMNVRAKIKVTKQKDLEKLKSLLDSLHYTNSKIKISKKTRYIDYGYRF